jgi:hypothetical protein
VITKSISDVRIKSEDQGTVEAVFARFDVIDKDGDVTRKGAFTEGAPVVISAYGHKSWEGLLPVGMGTIHEEGDVAVLKGQFFLDTTHGMDTFRTVKALSGKGLQEWSYSLQDVHAEKGTFDGKAVQFLNKIFVKEVSPTLVGAGVGTTTLAVKSEGLKFSDELAAVLAAVKGVAARKTEVVALRAEKGKGLSEEATSLVAELEEALASLKGELSAPTKSTDDAAMRSYLQFVAISQGVTK